MKESKSIQCLPEDISASPKSAGGTRPRAEGVLQKEVEVQTYQESKAVQCSDDELLEEGADSRHHIRFQSGPSSSLKTESSSSSCSSSYCFPAVVFVEDRADMTVTQRDHDGNVNWNKHWGPERLVEIDLQGAEDQLGAQHRRRQGA